MCGVVCIKLCMHAQVGRLSQKRAYWFTNIWYALAIWRMHSEKFLLVVTYTEARHLVWAALRFPQESISTMHAAILAIKRLLLLSCGCSSHADMWLLISATWMWLFLLPSSFSLPLYGYSCCRAAIPAIMQLFLLPCSYSCHNVAIFAAMQPLIVALWLFLLPCRYSYRHVAIFAAMQPLIVAMWIYSCCNAAIPATMWLFLLPCSH